MADRSASPASQPHLIKRAPIVKPPRPWPVEPNLDDYAAARAAFSWRGARQSLDGLPHGRGLNIAHEAVDRHAAGPRGQAVAIRWLGRDGQRQEMTYPDLRRETSRFANVLRRLGVARRDPAHGPAGPRGAEGDRVRRGAAAHALRQDRPARAPRA